MLAARQRYLKIRKGEIPVGRRHNMLAFDNGQGTQHFWIQRLPGADLVLDHIAAGEFGIHAESCVYRHRLWRIIRMDWMIACKALLLGVAEGLTEFIPVSRPKPLMSWFRSARLPHCAGRCAPESARLSAERSRAGQRHIAARSISRSRARRRRRWAYFLPGQSRPRCLRRRLLHWR